MIVRSIVLSFLHLSDREKPRTPGSEFSPGITSIEINVCAFRSLLAAPIVRLVISCSSNTGSLNWIVTNPVAEIGFREALG